MHPSMGVSGGQFGAGPSAYRETAMTTSAHRPAPRSARQPRGPDPATFLVFGVTGDLSQRMLLPALYRLTQERAVHEAFTVVGFARRPFGRDEFRTFAREAVSRSEGEVDPSGWQRFADRLYYASGDFTKADDYARVVQLLQEVERTHQTRGNRVFYLSTPPSAYEQILTILERFELVRPGSRDQTWSRVIIEKPFGHDLASAKQLSRVVDRVLGEDCIFRIDHYLGKETVQNMLAFRFANAIFEPIWNRRYVDHVQVTFAEDIGIGRRGRFYEEVGVVRDVIQNHVLQLLAIIAMEPPAGFDAEAFRNEKAKVLSAIPPASHEEAVRGQYGAGRVGGEAVPGYREQEGIDPHSKTPTYAAVRVHIESWRWAGVPFYLRAGKRLAAKDTEVAVVFRQPPLMLFQDYDMTQMEPNALVLKTTQDERISLGFVARVPGHRRQMRSVALDFRYAAMGEAEHPAYEHLLLDVLRGDQTFFARRDEVELQWSIVDPLLQYWADHPPKDFPNYAAGSWGPVEADRLLGRDGRRWHNA